jgi:hypothetical protein
MRQQERPVPAGSASFLASVRQAKRVRIEARFYQKGMHTPDFHTEGFRW